MGESVRAWHPEVPQLQEVLHATFQQHAYPAHTHDSWTVMILDRGAVTYDLHRSEHHAVPAAVTLLPPHVPHDGRSATVGRSFHKRVLYLEPGWLPRRAADAAVRAPTLPGAELVREVSDIHADLEAGDALAAEGALLELRGTVHERLEEPSFASNDAPLARRLRQMLDERLEETFTLAEAAQLLGVNSNHLVRAFSESYGIAPHRYVIGRRVDRARRLLLDGHLPAQVAVDAGFHDQPHLTRHFRRVLGTTPGAFRAHAHTR